MIRINLLGRERQKPVRTIGFNVGQQITLVCSLILVLTAGGTGWWYWSLRQASQQVDADLAMARAESERLKPILAAVQRLDDLRTELQVRVELIQELRRGQSVPVQLLDHVSKSVPDMLWLTELDETGPNVTISGSSSTLISLSDFVANLGSSTVLKKPIDIVNSEVLNTREAPGAPALPDVIKFSVKAQLTDTGMPATQKAVPAGGKAAGAGAAKAAPKAAPKATAPPSR